MTLVLSLFPGIGLLDMAFEMEGFCVVRGPDLLWGGDVKRFHPPAGRFDGVIGGPPCQAFSPLKNIAPAIALVGNLVPEFERCVAEASPAWFLMENVRAAPTPFVNGYESRPILLNNRWLEHEDGIGHPQNRVRRFTFGTPSGEILRTQFAALEHPEWSAAVTAAHGGERRTHSNRKTGGRIQRYRLEEACAMQGLAPAHFDGSPFRRDAALRMVANGVPLPMGRAVARAVRAALEDGRASQENAR